MTAGEKCGKARGRRSQVLFCLLLLGGSTPSDELARLQLQRLQS